MPGPPQASPPAAASASPLATASATGQRRVYGRQKPKQRKTLKEPHTQREGKRKKHGERHEEWTHCVDGHRYTLGETAGRIMGRHGCGPAKRAISAHHGHVQEPTFSEQQARKVGGAKARVHLVKATRTLSEGLQEPQWCSL